MGIALQMLRLPSVLVHRILASSSSVECYCRSRRLIHHTKASCKIVHSDGSEESKTKSSDDLKINLDEIEKALKEGKRPNEEKQFRPPPKPKTMKQKPHLREVLTMPVTVAVVAVSMFIFLVLSAMREKRLREMEDERKRTIGRARIGGPWELVDLDGKVGGSEQLKGNWLLLYFGFTHCPDVCPDSIEKMVEVVDKLEASEEKIKVIPVFISVDPERDTVERVKKYCSEFSPKIKGYTGSKEQVDKVAKTFRVYYSQGPKTSPDTNDYIVDHTVIMYLMDPDGEFHDYYGQNRTAEEIANIIKVKVFKYDMAHRQKKWF